ncbi:P2X purinoceptor 7-like [Hydractinia symbiolongicarpus]|uniref:P2X purinoceptor 7-like n=1 Tax=Hydractinia symbiolongicarpus TaxID=13093 RepID=UPI00254E2303|nr:P2X purinoceptor 7-like [Hydractinia symbiolongicarpus]
MSIMAESSTVKTAEDILQYLFEPVVISEGGEDEWTDCSSEANESDVEREMGKQGRCDVESETWCKCGHCQKKYFPIECICCVEVEETKRMIEKENIGCIIDHPGFSPVCLNVEVLWTSLVNLADREGAYLPRRNNVPNKSYRYAAYRQFTWWIHDKLGRHVRRVIPSCAVSRIRAEFEEEDGNYTFFRGHDDKASEIVNAMEWVRDGGN